MPGRGSWTWTDNSYEKGSIGVPLQTPTAGTYDAWVASASALAVCFENCTVNNAVQASNRLLAGYDYGQGKAASKLSQRENKLLLRYVDSAGDSFRVEIPCFNLTLLPDGSEFLDLTAGVGLALKTAFEAYARSPRVLLSTTLVSAQFVGRNR